jgi:hypothetical protein
MINDQSFPATSGSTGRKSGRSTPMISVTTLIMVRRGSGIDRFPAAHPTSDAVTS